MKLLLAGLAVLVLGACSTSNPVAPSKQAPTKAAQSRYILISGDTPPYAGCYNGGAGYWVCPDLDQ